MFKKIFFPLLILLCITCITTIRYISYADNIQAEEYKQYEQTKQIIVKNNFDEKIERLEYCNTINTCEVTQKINIELSKKLILSSVNNKLFAAANNLEEELGSFTKNKSKEKQVGKILYSDLNVTYDEEYLLAVIIFCEAGNQSYDGKIAVGNVVLNRVASPKFKQTTIEDVIRAPGQFEPVKTGWYDSELRKGTVNESCMQAAKDALNGVNIVGDCVFFHKTKGYDDGIIIGDHVFYK